MNAHYIEVSLLHCLAILPYSGLKTEHINKPSLEFGTHAHKVYGWNRPPSGKKGKKPYACPTKFIIR